MPAKPGGFRPVNAVDVVPARRLELEPVIESVGDVDVALEERAYLKSLKATAVARCEAHVRLVKAEGAKQLLTEVDGRDVSIDDRLDALDAAIDAALERGLRGQIFTSDCKTCERTHGVLSYADAPLSLGYAEGQDAESVLETIEKKTRDKQKRGVFAQLGALLSRRKLLKRPLDTFLRLKREVNIVGIKAELKAKKLALVDVEGLGLMQRGGDERLSIESKTYVVTAQTPAAGEPAGHTPSTVGRTSGG